MSKEQMKMMLPRLRFPEFKGRGEWDEKSLGSVCQTFSGGTPPTTKNEFYGGHIPFIRSAEIDRETTELFLTAEGLASSSAKLVTKGDVLVALYGANSGEVALAKLNGAINQAILCLNSNEINSFIYQFLLLIKNWIVSTYVQGGQGNLSGEIIKSIKLLFPNKDEQQKIASCLSSIDDLIAAHTQKLADLKAHKKGLMQQLFPAEGEKVPKLRFPEFRDSGEWKEKKLAECLLKHPEYGINAPAVTYSIKLPTYLRITDISEEGFFLKDQKVSVEKEVTKDNYLEEGDIVLARTGASVGKSYKYRAEDGELVFAGFLIRIKPDTSKINPELLFQYLSTDKYWRWVAFTSTRSGQPGINGNEYALLPILLPLSILEQQKIASGLSSISELIRCQAERIKQLENHKKGLMQGLFPNINNVSE